MAGLAREVQALSRKLSLDHGNGAHTGLDSSPKSTQQLFQSLEASTSAPLGTGAARSDDAYIPPPVGLLPHAASLPAPARSFMARNVSVPAAREAPSSIASCDGESVSASLSPTRFSFWSRRPLGAAARASSSRGVSMDTDDCGGEDSGRFAHSQPIPIAHESVAHRALADTAQDDMALYDAAMAREDELKASYREWHDCVYSASSL